MYYTVPEVLERINAMETVEFEYDWRMIVTPTSGTIWVNTKTGQFRQYPPNYVVKRQQEQIKQVDKDKEELEEKIASLKLTLEKYEADVKQKDILEERCGDWQSKYDEKVAQIQRLSRSADKVKVDLKVREEKCILYEKEVNTYLERVTKLEEKLKEVTALEEKISDLTHKLDTSETNSRQKDMEVIQSHMKMNDAEKKFQEASNTIKTLTMKNEEMKHQVRAEVDRNTRIELGLREMQSIKEENEKTRAELTKILSEVDTKDKLLASARRSVRQYRDRIKTLEATESEYLKIQEELKLISFENITLKKLMAGKDSLLVQKTHALDLARQLIVYLKSKDEHIGAEVERLLDRVNFVPAYSFGSDKPERRLEIRSMTPTTEASGFTAPVNGTADREHTKSPTSSLSTSPSLKPAGRVNTSTTRELLGMKSSRSPATWNSESNLSRSTSLSPEAQGHHGSTPSLQATTPDASYRAGPSRLPTASPKTAVVRPQPIVHSAPYWGDPDLDSDAGSSVRTESRLSKLSAHCGVSKHDLDRLSALFIHMGDRVQVLAPKDGSLLVATVKYIGPLNKQINDRRMFVGVKLEECVGDCDGTYNGVHYFSTPKNRGLILRSSEVHSVYSVKGDKFKQLEECLEDYMKRRNR